jgi:hypothetical protein
VATRTPINSPLPPIETFFVRSVQFNVKLLA